MRPVTGINIGKTRAGPPLQLPINTIGRICKPNKQNQKDQYERNNGYLFTNR